MQEKFASNLRKFLAESKITQRKCAELVGTTEAAVSRWVHGTRMPNSPTLKVLADVLNVKMEDFFV